ncbi:hypothetical protein DL764_000142 [Monosporascus ibericus]|uniref:glycine dehydrogenase (aminomethyl-transferring) n=1 Tax=Monosporascus ibericus TaxID=155417 RepID=A0A4Q4TXE2_9PEZI|nr:hypothetical protein DL764_000142 [Monosporascus ibericus]
MASSARAIPRGLGQLAAHSRVVLSPNARLPLSRPWTCHQCAYRGALGVRRAFSKTSAARATEDVNAVPHSAAAAASFAGLDTFPRRHIGPDDNDTAEMLKALSPPVENLDAFVAQVIPADILSQPELYTAAEGRNFTESGLRDIVDKFRKQITIKKSFIGQGYYGTHTPAVIQRNVLENPAWYTSYTPYQPEISQGRLESLVNFQTMVSDLTALPIANASLLDEGTAAAEAMTLSINALSSSRARRERKIFVVSKTLHPQTFAVMQGRAEGFGIELLALDLSTPEATAEIEALGEDLAGVMVQYPDTFGNVMDFQDLAAMVHKQGALLSAATDLLALTLLKPPGEWGADIAFGSAQRFGVPMGYGGPHAAFFAVSEKHKRKIPGRLVGLSKDRLGGKAYRLALQTREQHIRREKATSNVCTSQALLANMSAFYAIYHGPEGLRAIAERVVRGARVIQAAAEAYGLRTGYHNMSYYTLLSWFQKQLASVTGMDKVSLQPNSGAQGEFAGLRAIREYLKSHGKGDKKRDICLIPVSAHGTNPASAAMAGMRVVPIKCDVKTGNLDLEDLEAKCKQYQDELGAIMVTYPSTYGVFEPEIRKACELVHEYGGQVYMDGANMNAQIGLCSPGDIGADVCHLNLHKTFCIPHGGGGPGVGPICVKSHLAPHLPGNARLQLQKRAEGWAVSSAPFGSASINTISWAYNTLMGADGLTHATKIGLLNANYMLSRLQPHYPILYTNAHGRCAHEFILDARPFRESAGVEVIDIAKRLQDYGFHSPTMSWPVNGTLMIEPTESESREELDRFVDALISIRQEIRDVEEGRAPRDRNVLKMAPHSVRDIVEGDDGNGGWDRPYSRQQAAYPLPWLREKKFWPAVGRVDDAYGDLNLFCTCPPVEDTTGAI